MDPYVTEKHPLLGCRKKQAAAMPEHDEEELGLCQLRLVTGEKDASDSHHQPNPILLTMTTRLPKFFLVIHNIQKRPNVRNLLCTAAAFGCDGVFVVGQKNFNLDPIASPDIPLQIKGFLQEGGMLLKRFDKWADFVEYVGSTRQIRLIGVEIHKDAKDIDHYLTTSDDGSSKDIAFLMGNEGQGLSQKQQDDCDGFVRIPQYGNGTASLNVNVAASIILQRVYQWQHATNAVS
jgi:tRNA G18 (ribose-2'-O)-methylase SpoU